MQLAAVFVRRLAALVSAVAFLTSTIALASPAATVREVVGKPDQDLSFFEAKPAFDHIIELNFSDAAVTAQVDRIAAAATRISSGGNVVAP